MDDFHQLSTPIEQINNDMQTLQSDSKEVGLESSIQSTELDDLKSRVNALYQQLGEQPPEPEPSDIDINTLNEVVNEKLQLLTGRTNQDKQLDLQAPDVIVASFAGGLAVLVDFLIVKVPKNMKFRANGETYTHSGSPLTELFRKIGYDKDGNTAQWVKFFEDKFHVHYDMSWSQDIPNMYPKNHRVYSLGHDPSANGLIWSIKDLVQGTFSYIDKNGILHIDKVAPADWKKLFYAPILWLGHLISDVFTKQGIPIPGTCLLRTLQFGSIGEKERTIGQIAEYMYVQGYDLRHLATMATCNAVIGLVVNIYHWLLSKPQIDETLPLSEKEYLKVKGEQKKRKMMLIANSVAVAGNIGKVAAYHGSPFAVNLPVWYQFIREAIAQAIIQTSDSQKYIAAIENRHVIDANFEQYLAHLLSSDE